MLLCRRSPLSINLWTSRPTKFYSATPSNSIFNGDKLLTTPNPEFNEDQALFQTLGLTGKPAHVPAREPQDLLEVVNESRDRNGDAPVMIEHTSYVAGERRVKAEFMAA